MQDESQLNDQRRKRAIVLSLASALISLIILIVLFVMAMDAATIQNLAD